MLYRTKVAYRAGGRQYSPGSLLPAGIPQADLAFLRVKGWLEPVDAAPAVLENMVGDMEMGGSLEGMEFTDAKSPDGVWKMRSKKEVHAYAQSIGLDLGDGYGKKALKDLQAEVADFIGEQMEDGLHEF